MSIVTWCLVLCYCFVAIILKASLVLARWMVEGLMERPWLLVLAAIIILLFPSVAHAGNIWNDLGDLFAHITLWTCWGSFMLLTAIFTWEEVKNSK